MGHDSFIYKIVEFSDWLVWDMTHSCMWHDSFIYVAWRIHMWNVAHSYLWHDLFVWSDLLICGTDLCNVVHWYMGLICVERFVYRLDLFVWFDSLICETYSCQAIYWYVGLICVMWFITVLLCVMGFIVCGTYSCDMISWYTYLCEVIHWHVGRIRVKWFINMWDWFVWCDALIDAFICGAWFIHGWDMTHSYVGHDSFVCVTGLIHT